MADLGEDFELGEVLLILGAVGLGIYLLYKLVGGIGDYFKNATCITKVGTIPGVTGATQQQAQAPQIAAGVLKPGGSTIWSCGSDYDYAQPNGDVVQVRSSFWGQLFGTPVTYTTVPRDSYVRPAGGTVNPAFADCYACCTSGNAGGGPPLAVTGFCGGGA